MKNRSTMLLLGVGVAYILYRLYAKKPILPPGIVEAVQKPLALYPSAPSNGGGGANYIEPSKVPTQFLVDKVRDESIPFDMPNTYQTFYGRQILGNVSKVPSTC
jgi:hypothetical protein